MTTGTRKKSDLPCTVHSYGKYEHLPAAQEKVIKLPLQKLVQKCGKMKIHDKTK